MIMKMKEIVEKNKCGFKRYLSSMDLKQRKSLNYYIGVSFKKVMCSKDRSFFNDEEEIYQHLLENINTNIFTNKFEYEENLRSLSKLIKRYGEFETKHFNVIAVNPKCDLKFGTEEVTVSADVVLELKNNSNQKFIVSFDKSKPSLSYRAKIKENSPYYNLPLYLYNKMGEELYPGCKIKSSFVSMKSKGDSDEKLDDFDKRRGYNVIAIDNKESYIDDKYILDLIQSKDISKCSSQQCLSCSYTNICNYTEKEIQVNKIEKANDENDDTQSVVYKPSFKQLSFINKEQGNIRVNAVAGSGKTTAIAKRVLKLLEKGYPANKILLITFSEKGCGELYSKLNYWNAVDGNKFDIENIDIKTFNGFCYDLIKENYLDLGFTKKPSLVDKVSACCLIAEAIKDKPKIEGMNYKNPFIDYFYTQGVCVELLALFNNIKVNQLIYPEEVEYGFKFSKDKALNVLLSYIEYNKLLKKNNLLDFQDQIDLGTKLILQGKAKNYEHIIVDEYQDSDKQQLYIIKKLSENKDFKSLAVLGDENQSIYSFRNTSSKNILDFDKDFSNVIDINFSRNFRSTQQIVNLANIINAKNGSDKKLISSKSGHIPTLCQGDSDKIINIIEEHLKNGVKLEDIAVVARTKRELFEISEKLNDKKIPNILRVGEYLIDNSKIKNIIGYSNFLNNKSLLMHFIEYLEVVDFKGYSTTTDLRDYINKKYVEFTNKYPIDNLSEKQKVFVFFDSLKEVAKTDSAIEKLLSVLQGYNFKTIRALSNYLNNMAYMKSDLSISKDEGEYNAIDLITAHSAKGREYKYVIAMLDKYKLPFFDKNFECNEEIRLLYVTITRAKENLTIVSNRLEYIKKLFA